MKDAESQFAEKERATETKLKVGGDIVTVPKHLGNY